jgi:hypothetical protein
MKYIIGIVAITGLMILWAIVQYLWKNIFLDQQTNEDVLAGRSDCGSCGCSTLCSKKTNALKNKR